ncbi:MAG TPA: HEAT repeat domain-containing protein [Acidimicrobiales bacterium]|jgi:HEAT repeat protein
MRARQVVLAGHGAEPSEVVADALEDEDPELRARAVSAAHRLGHRSEPERVRSLRDPSALVRRRACEIEARAPAPSPVVDAALIACLDDDDALVVVAAADALGESEARSATDALAQVAVGHDDPRCREAAVAALGSIGDQTGLDAVLAALSDKPAVRRRAVVALAGFEGPEVEAGIDAALGDRDWQVRQAAEALRAGDEPKPT